MWRRLQRDTPLSLRLTLLYVAILAIVLGVLSVTLYTRVENFLIADTKNRLTIGAEQAINRPKGGGGGRSPYGSPPGGNYSGVDNDRLAGITRELSSQITVARILSADGTVLADGQSNTDQPAPPACSPDDIERTIAGEKSYKQLLATDTHHLVVLMPMEIAPTTTGVLQITTSLAAADDLLEQLRLILILGTLGATILGTLLGVTVTRAALRPLARVTATSERIAAGNLGQRTELPDGKDEIGRLSSAFDHMVDRLEDSLRAQRQFVADASHELRTPLTALGGLIEMLMLGADRGDTATTQRALRSAHREVERLARLVGDLLTLSRLDARPTIERHPFDLAALVAEVGEQTRYLAGERTVAWQTSGAIPMEGDRDRLKQVLLNLTGNAAAFTAATGTIELRAERQGQRARIEVSDDGAGIDPTELPRLFERFYRGDKSRARRADGGGNGLGLAIAQAIVQAHDGTIVARSTVGQGTTFTIELPLTRPAAPNEATEATTQAAPKEHAVQQMGD